MRRLIAFVALLLAVAPLGAKQPGTPPFPASVEVQAIAERYIASLPKSTTPEQIKQAREAFIWSFLEGYTEGSDGAIWSNDAATSKGFKAGQIYRHQRPEGLAHIMSGFGYKPISLRGTWQVGPELSGFIPTNNPNARWWLSILGNSPAAKSHISAEPCPHVQITGFLSPRGQYGHMGGFTREVYVNTLNCLG